MKLVRHYLSMPAGVTRIERIEAAVEPLQNGLRKIADEMS
jgi:hypothetical protein